MVNGHDPTHGVTEPRRTAHQPDRQILPTMTPGPVVAAEPGGRPDSPGTPSELTKASIYLDELTDAYLENVRATGRRARPRVDATRSAVVRLALNRLASQLDVAAVIAELQRNASGHPGPGRRRG